MAIWADYQLNIFIASGNMDKVKRVSTWLEGVKCNIVTLNDLDESLAAATKMSDDEEKSYGNMEERALGKVKKAAKLLPKDTNILVLATDDTAYLPLTDTEIIDMRTPPAIYKDKRHILPPVVERLSGKALANYYANLTNLVVEGKENGLDYKYMPLVWRFALAVCPAGDTKSAKVIAKWEKRQYLRGVLLEGDVEDTGYMMDKVTSDTPDGPLNALSKGNWDERVPKEALKGYLS